MSIFKAYDVRGIYDKDLFEKDAYLIGFYLPRFLKVDSLKIAHDMRLSFGSLTKFFIKGVLDSGSQVIYLGKSSTPNFYFSLFSRVDSGVMITASHNPKEYNGFKIMHKMNSFDSQNGLFDLEKEIKQDAFNISNRFEEIEKEIEVQNLSDFLEENGIAENSTLEKYDDFILKFYDSLLLENEKEILKNMNFAVDFSSGVSSLSGVHFLKKTGLNYNLLNEIPDGNFPNHSPDPMKAQKYLKNENIKSNFSAVFDGDGDRILFYDENNELIFPDYVIAMLIDYFSKDSKNFVVDLRVSRILEDMAKEKNLNLGLIRVGRAFYKAYMDKNDCIFGAELSGHLFFREFKNFDNPDIALIYVLKIIASFMVENNLKTFKFSEIVSKYKVYHKIKETNVEVEDADKVISTLEKKYEKNIVLRIDGLSFDFGNYWFNIRKSNTEPIIRINFEGVEKVLTEDEFNNLLEFIKEI